MSKVNELHNRAMDLAELGLVERLRGNPEAELGYARQALEFEVAATQALTDRIEPTFSVLHRSAATIALQCGEHRLAEQLAAKALAEEPPNEIAEELRDVLEQAQFQRHLSLRGVELGPDELQMSLSGKGVGYGTVAVDAWAGRIQNVAKLIQRIVEWQQKLSFGKRGARQKTKEEFPILVSAHRAASFAVTLKVGHPVEPRHPIKIQAAINDFMDLMEMTNGSDIHGLSERVPESLYLSNFIQSAKEIAPDGERVSQVGFTTGRGNSRRQVSVTRAEDLQIFSPRPRTNVEPARHVKIRGTLRFVDYTDRQSPQIKIVDGNGKHISVNASAEIMNDVVREMWNMKVVVDGLKKGRSIHLEDIALDEQD